MQLGQEKRKKKGGNDRFEGFLLSGYNDGVMIKIKMGVFTKTRYANLPVFQHSFIDSADTHGYYNCEL